MVLNYEASGVGPVIVLLHGMAGSLRYWNAFLPYISQGHRVIAIDLLGFGRSPKPKSERYGYDSHIKSIDDTLKHAGVTGPFILAGHSMGGLIALRLAVTYPEKVTRLALVAMPIYENAADARATITGQSRLKRLAYYGNTSRILCTVWCRLLRPLSLRLAPIYLPHLSRDSAMDSVLHTWLSYSRSLHQIIENQRVADDLLHLNCPTLLLYGSQDTPKYLKQTIAGGEAPNIKVMVVEGTHQIIHEQPSSLYRWLVS